MCVEKEMTLREWCGRLSQLHLVNKELKTVKRAMYSLLRWIDMNTECGLEALESYQDTDKLVDQALNILGEDMPDR